jgi:hypothetical protein
MKIITQLIASLIRHLSSICYNTLQQPKLWAGLKLLPPTLNNVEKTLSDRVLYCLMQQGFSVWWERDGTTWHTT